MASTVVMNTPTRVGGMRVGAPRRAVAKVSSFATIGGPGDGAFCAEIDNSMQYVVWWCKKRVFVTLEATRAQLYPHHRLCRGPEF